VRVPSPRLWWGYTHISEARCGAPGFCGGGCRGGWAEREGYAGDREQVGGFSFE
jgi:hypothetical protein